MSINQFEAVKIGTSNVADNLPVSKQLTILIVDDSEDDIEYVTRSLSRKSKYKYFFLKAASSKEAMLCLSEHTPDCILLDYSLPGETGLTLLSTIVSDKPFLPVILLTGMGSEEVAVKAIKSGASDYVSKSKIISTNLEASILQCIEQKKYENIIEDKNIEILKYQNSYIEKQKRTERVVDATGIVLWEYDLSSDKFYIDERIKNIIYSTFDASLSLKDFRSLVHPDDLEFLNYHWNNFVSCKTEKFNVSYRIRGAAGKWVWIKDIGNRLESDSDGQQKIVGLIQDINKEKNEEFIINQLYSTSFDLQGSSQEKIDKILLLGLEYFDFQFAVVSEIRDKDYIIRYFSSLALEDISPGDVFSLDETYCSTIFGKPGVYYSSNFIIPSAISSVKVKGYIGTTLYINSLPYGTLSFYSTKKLASDLSSREKSFMGLLTQWISSEHSRKLYTDKLEESEEFLDLIQNSIPDPLTVKDESLKIVRANKAYTESVLSDSAVMPVRKTLYSTSNMDEKVQGKRLKGLSDIIFDPDSLVLNGNPCEFEECYNIDQNIEKSYLTKKILFKDKSDTSYILSLSKDITQLRDIQSQLALSEEKFETAVEASNIGIWRYNLLSGEFYLSPKARDLLYIKNKDKQSLDTLNNWLNTLYHDDRELIKEKIESHLLNEENFNVEFRVCHRKNSDPLWFRMKGDSVRDELGNPVSMSGALEDITSIKKSINELIKANEELERFAYMASHDLQEPLRMVSGFMSLLKKRFKTGDVLTEAAEMYIDHACQGATRMQCLVKDLLEYARVGDESETYQIVDLDRLKSQVLTNLESGISDKNAVIRWSKLPKVRGSAARLCSVFQNIIGNAIKYSRNDVPPEVIISCESKRNYWLFTVSDNGIGIKPEFSEKIFEPFKRLHGKNEYSGVGMGLSICRKIIESLEGEIWVEANSGDGCKFVFTLPKV
ncbi:hypothetical protein MAH4_04200 [Sessilibacter sp. MAH4]